MHMEAHAIEEVESWDEPTLAGCRLKAARATELLMALQWEIQQFRLNGQLIWPSSPRAETDDLGNHWAVIYCDSVAEVPVRFSLLAGDVVHNLRSVLDHLVYQLVLLDGGKPSRQTSWLFLRDEADDRGVARYKAALKGIKNKDVLTMIEWLQPFVKPSNLIRENLALLADVDNIDKHRLIRPGVALITKSATTEQAIVSTGEVRAGSELFRFLGSPDDPIDIAYRYELAFWDQQVTIEKIAELRETLRGVLEKFSVFFADRFFSDA